MICSGAGSSQGSARSLVTRTSPTSSIFTPVSDHLFVDVLMAYRLLSPLCRRNSFAAAPPAFGVIFSRHARPQSPNPSLAPFAPMQNPSPNASRSTHTSSQALWRGRYKRILCFSSSALDPKRLSITNYCIVLSDFEGVISGRTTTGTSSAWAWGWNGGEVKFKTIKFSSSFRAAISTEMNRINGGVGSFCQFSLLKVFWLIRRIDLNPNMTTRFICM